MMTLTKLKLTAALAAALLLVAVPSTLIIHSVLAEPTALPIPSASTRPTPELPNSEDPALATQPLIPSTNPAGTPPLLTQQINEAIALLEAKNIPALIDALVPPDLVKQSRDNGEFDRGVARRNPNRPNAPSPHSKAAQKITPILTKHNTVAHYASPINKKYDLEFTLMDRPLAHQITLPPTPVVRRQRGHRPPHHPPSQKRGPRDSLRSP